MMEGILGKDIMIYLRGWISLVLINEKKMYYYNKWIKIILRLRIEKVYHSITNNHLYPFLPQFNDYQKLIERYQNEIYEFENIKKFHYFNNDIMGFNVELFCSWKKTRKYDNSTIIFSNRFNDIQGEQGLYDKHIYGLFFKGLFNNTKKEREFRNKCLDHNRSKINICKIEGNYIIFFKF